MKKLWTRCEESIPRPRFLTRDTTQSWYHLEYISGGSYQQYPSNSHIENFKKSIKYRNEPCWGYKEDAIQYFAEKIMEVLKFKSRPDMIIVPMFTSKSRNDPEFDDRLECVAKYVREKTSQRIGFNLDVIRSSEPFHNSRALRVPAEIEKTISFTPFKPPIPTKVLLIDDVVTTGAHFIACNNKIKVQYPDIEIFGLFLAKTKWEVTEPQHSSDTNSVSDEFFGK